MEIFLKSSENFSDLIFFKKTNSVSLLPQFSSQKIFDVMTVYGKSRCSRNLNLLGLRKKGPLEQKQDFVP